MNTISLATHMLMLEEGWRDKPYYCSEGYPTVGYGFKIGDKGDPLPKFKLPLSAGIAWLDSEARMIIESLLCESPWYANLDSVRQAVFISMAYQIGISGLMKFKKAIAAASAQDWETCHAEMLDSNWYAQTPERAKRHAWQVLHNEIHEYYL